MTRWGVIVVGGGLLGAAVARRVREAGRTCLIAERGVDVSDPPGSHVRNSPSMRDDPDGYFDAIDRYFEYFDREATPERLPGAFRTTGNGGMGIVWTNNCPRAVPGVDRPALLTEDEWDRYYAIAEGYLGVSADQFEDSRRQQRVVERLDAVLAAQERQAIALPLSGVRRSHDRIHYVGPADVLAGADAAVVPGTVDSIVFDGDTAIGVRAGGILYEGDAVVVSAGAIDTPALLWRSGRRLNALGRYLSYHPVLIGQIVLDEALCAPPADPDPIPRLGIPPTADRPWFTMLLRDTNPLSVDPADRAVDANRLIEIQAFAPVDPHRGSRMSFADDGRIDFAVPLRDADEARRHAIERDADELTAQLGRFRGGCRPQWAPLGTPHLMGSCRMGTADDGTSVADNDGRVWGTENLYVATNGVLPGRVAVNPTLTAAAIAVRTVDRLLASVGATRVDG